jgi:SAM-dependent methyltransferase
VREAYYNEYFAAEERHWWFRGRSAILLAAFERYRPPETPRPRVLDVGCGSGGWLQRIAPLAEVHGVDFSAEAVAACRRRGLAGVEQMSGETIPHGESAFDVVTLFDVLEHVDDDAHLVREARRVLRQGGTLLVSVPAYRLLWGLQDEVSHHRRRYTARRLRAPLRAAGVDILHLSYFNTLLFAPIAAVRLARRVRPADPTVSSDFQLGPPAINRALGCVFASEARIVTRRRVPFGVSILAAARRP